MKRIQLQSHQDYPYLRISDTNGISIKNETVQIQAQLNYKIKVKSAFFFFNLLTFVQRHHFFIKHM